MYTFLWTFSYPMTPLERYGISSGPFNLENALTWAALDCHAQRLGALVAKFMFQEYGKTRYVRHEFRLDSSPDSSTGGGDNHCVTFKTISFLFETDYGTCDAMGGPSKKKVNIEQEARAYPIEILTLTDKEFAAYLIDLRNFDPKACTESRASLVERARLKTILRYRKSRT